MKKIIAGLFFVVGFLGFFLVQKVPPQSQTAGVTVISMLPNSTLTPGAINPNVTQENLKDTVCKPNWAATIRPPVSYTNPLKKKLIDTYGYADKNMANYELDHLISIVLGGNPTDPKNLWPEAYLPKPGAREKDAVENFLHRQVCGGIITLSEAQKEISTDWYSVYLHAGLSKQLGSQAGDPDGN